MNDEPSFDLLPLFSLPLACLPEEVIGMHIFEPRYQEMLRHCLEQANPEGDFVVLYEDPLHASDIGCVVSIVSTLKENADGTRDILVKGRRRVRVLERFDLHAYTSAKIEPLHDRGEEESTEDSSLQLYGLHRQLILRTQGDEPPNSFYEHAGSMAYLVASCSGVDIETRLKLLAMDSEAERQQLVISQLEELLPLVSKVLPVIQEAIGGYALTRQVAEATRVANAGDKET